MSTLSTKKVKGIDMTEGSPLRSLVLFAIPLVLGDLLQQLYNATDSIIVGRYVSKEALAAVGQAIYPINIFLGFSIGIGLGCTVSISRVFGAKDKDGMAKTLNTVLRLCFVMAVVMTAVSLLILPGMLKIMGTNEDAYQYTYDYLSIYFMGISSQIAYNMFAGILRAVGDSRRPLYVLIITAIMNVGGDLLLVKGLNMGTAGAAIATVAAQLISVIILWFMILSADAFENPVVRKEHMNPAIVKRIMGIGIPYGLQRSIISFSNSIVMSFFNKVGSDAVAAWSICTKVDQVSNNIATDIGSALTTFTSQNIGAGKPERIRTGFRTALALNFAADSVLIAFFLLAQRPITALFTNDMAVREISRTVFFVMLPLHPLTTISTTCASRLRGLGNSTAAMFSTGAFFVLARQAYLHIGWPIYHSLIFVLLAFPTTWILNIITVAICDRVMTPKLIRKLNPSANAADL